MKKAVIIGAGALGLGFLAERMSPDYHVYLVDVPEKADLLHHIQENRGFTLNICSLSRINPVRVTGRFDTIVNDGQAKLHQVLQEADLVLTATNRKLIDTVVEDIAPIMNSRMQKGWLLFCENGLDIAATYSSSFNAQTTLVDTVMSRMCRFAEQTETDYEPMWPDGNTSLVVDDYNYLPLDANLCKGGPFRPAFSMVGREEFHCLEDMKLYLHNGMHAFISYHAFLEGVEFFKDTPLEIRERAREVVLQEVLPAIVSTHPAANGERLQQYGLELLERFFNPYFNDSIERGTRGIEEKLAPGERLVGGCEYIRRAGIEPKGYASTIETAKKIQSMQDT